MPRAKLVTLDKIEMAKKMARETPAKTEITQMEAITRLLPSINKLLAKGFTLKEIQKMWAEKGLDFHMSKLKKVVEGSKKPRADQTEDFVGPTKPRNKRSKKAKGATDTEKGATSTEIDAKTP